MLDISDDEKLRISKLADGEGILLDQKNLDIENRFSYHKPNNKKQDIFPLIRDKAKEFAYLIQKHVPNSREKSLALTKLEEVVMWANAGISRN